jgi:hypothetical protein
MDYKTLKEVTQQMIIAIASIVVMIYTVVKFLDDKLGIDVFEGCKKRIKEKKLIKTKQKEIDNIQQLMRLKLLNHEGEINSLILKLLNETGANKSFLAELVNDYNIPFENSNQYNLMKICITHEHCNNAISEKQKWQDIPVGFLNGVAVEIYEKRFGIIYVKPEDFKKDYKIEDLPYRIKALKEFGFLMNDLRRQKCNMMFITLLCCGQDPYALIGLSFNNENNYLETNKIEDIKQKMFDLAFIISRERYGKNVI